ncbi:MAG: hypothetical protein AAF570_21560 [Bacteroidota bacterium]
MKKCLRGGLYLALLSIFLLLVLEFVYRHQWIDTYRRELTYLNPDSEAETGRPNLLVMGDSYTAARHGWVQSLREAFPEHRIINSAVPGTGAVQAGYMAGNRFSDFPPRTFIYQIYVGNDLFDYRLPVNWSELGFARNIYYSFANHLRSLSWLNYSLAQFGTADDAEVYTDARLAEDRFDPARYNGREKLYLKAEPGLIENSALLRGDRADDMPGYLAHLDALMAHCNGDCQAWIVILPHCAQVHTTYRERMQTLGATISDPTAFRARAYPFVQAIRDHFQQNRPEIRILNALPAFQKAEAKGIQLYYENDPHLNQRGQAILGELVVRALKVE